MARVIDAVMSLKDKFSPTLRLVNKALDISKTAMSGAKSQVVQLGSKLEEMNKVNARTAKSFQKIGKSMASMQNAAVVVTLTAAAEKGYEASKKINGAVNQMKIWGDITDETAAKMKVGILSISSTYAIANDQVAEATQQAVKSGIKEGEVLEWMSNTAKFARVAKMDLAETTKYGAQMSKAYNLSTADTAAAYNQLTTAAKACHGDIDKITASVAALSPKAAQAGISLSQLTTTLAMMRNRGYDEAQSGGIMDSMITSIAKAQPALAKLGIDVSAARIQAQGLAPVIADVYAKMGDDTKFKALFKNVDGYKMAMMMASKDGVSEWQGMLKQINEGSASTLDKMWSQMQTPGEKTQQAMTDLANAWVTVGDALAPVFTKSATMIKTLLAAYNGLSDGQKALIANVIQFVIVFGALTVAVGGAMSLIGTWIGLVSGIVPAIEGIAGAAKFVGKNLLGLTKIFKLVGMAARFLFANPIGIAIMIIIGLCYLIYTYWTPIKEFFVTLWVGIVNTFNTSINSIKEFFAGLWLGILSIATTGGNALGSIINWIANFFTNGFDTMSNIARDILNGLLNNIFIIITGIVGVFSGIITFLTGAFTGDWSMAWQGIVDVFSSIFSTIAAICNNVLGTVKAVINDVISGINNISVDVPNWVPMVGGQHYQPAIPMLAKGTDNWGGGVAMIHDAGAEIVDLPTGSRVIPHDKSMDQEYERGKADSKANGFVLNIPKLADTIIVREDADIDKIIEMLAFKLKSYAINQAEGAV